MNNIKFTAREDYVQAVQHMAEGLKKYYSPGKAFVSAGYTATHYGNRTIGLEGFSRILWGLVPLWAGGGTSCLDSFVPEGIRHGTSRVHEEYWGTYQDGEQAYVEMAVFGLGLLLVPEKIWEPLSESEKGNFNQWLMQINEHRISDNNWLFFRVLVNCGLRKVSGIYCEEQLQKDLERIDDFYQGDGWYTDGATRQVDYYIGFAMHFYSLLYAALLQKEDPKRCARYRERARLFAQDFIYWFGEKGEALPFGRSLGYRFAQGSFWCALAFAGEEVFSWGVIKGIVNRHLRFWFEKPILDCEDKLTLGYCYPNLTVGEGYNSPNSPYWAWKSFLILALPQEHPFWEAEEEPLPVLEPVHTLKHPMMVMQRGMDGYVTALTSGQYAEWEPVHCAEKYGKFAYSSYFGFQVPRSYCNLAQTAPDNMLAFYKDGYYHVRRRCREVTVKDGRIISHWEPLKGVKVETVLIPNGKGHIRRHLINALEDCAAAEGGFALPVDEPKEAISVEQQGYAKVSSNRGTSSISLIQGEGEGKVILCEANVNLVHPRTMLPYLSYEFKKGITVIEVYVEGTSEQTPERV
ncbi:DUF2264 domain-containing protein [uncultured Robinsoniella sp.]|uniref:DUF2264 domain-containing protein n=1 Tax=Robinsoniella sp. TaxID=2496533 RepID=UPI00374F3D24